MAKVKADEIVEHLSAEFQYALKSAVNEVLPDATFNNTALFNAFKRAVSRKCSTWETVPDTIVQK